MPAKHETHAVSWQDFRSLMDWLQGLEGKALMGSPPRDKGGFYAECLELVQRLFCVVQRTADPITVSHEDSSGNPAADATVRLDRKWEPKSAQSRFWRLNKILAAASKKVFGARAEDQQIRFAVDPSAPGRRILVWSHAKATSSRLRLAMIRWRWHSQFMADYCLGVYVAAKQADAELLDVRIHPEVVYLIANGQVVDEVPVREPGQQAVMLRTAVDAAHELGYDRVIISLGAELDAEDLSRWKDAHIRLVISGGHPAAADYSAICIRQNDHELGRQLAQFLMDCCAESKPDREPFVLGLRLKDPPKGSPEAVRWAHFYAKLGQDRKKWVMELPIDQDPGKTGWHFSEQARRLVANVRDEAFSYRFIVTMFGDIAIGADQALTGLTRKDVKILSADAYGDLLERLMLPDEESRMAAVCGLDSFHMGLFIGERALAKDEPKDKRKNKRPESNPTLLPTVLLDFETVQQNHLMCATDLVRRFPQLTFDDLRRQLGQAARSSPRKKRRSASRDA
jgi:hypothetical protein